MAALTCDLCGGKLVMGAGGVAVCDSCGMEHGADRMKEKIQEIKGVVRVDNTHMVDNYLTMAENAMKASNNSEAEGYCNKIIEIDPNNYKAWLIKGKAAGWQSTLAKPRFNESALAFANAIKNAPAEEKQAVTEDSKNTLGRLASALITLRGERFEKWPDKEEVEGFSKDISAILNSLTMFLTQAHVPVHVSEIMQDAATKINLSVVAAWKKKILPDYNGNGKVPSKYDFERFIDRIGNCNRLLEKAVDLSKDDDEADIQRYENMIVFHQAAINACSYKTVYTNGIKRTVKDYTLTADAINSRAQTMAKYREKINAIKAAAEEKKKKEATKRIEDYWKAHAEEKAQLEQEKAQLEEQIAPLKAEIDAIPGNDEIKALQDKNSALQTEQSSLGLFKGKQKKELQAQIDANDAEIRKIRDRMNAATREIEAKISPLRKRINEIDAEFTKPR